MKIWKFTIIFIVSKRQKLGYRPTSRKKAIARDRNNSVNDYMNKAVRKIIDYCISNDIDTLVVSYNETFQNIKIFKQGLLPLRNSHFYKWE